MLVKLQKVKKIAFLRFFSEGSLALIEKNLVVNSSLYKKQQEKNSSKGLFVLVEKPLPINGNLHIGHVYNKLLKDIIVRARLLDGYKIEYLPGFSCFNTELELELMEEKNKENNKNNVFKSYLNQEIYKMCHDKTIEKLKEYIKTLSSLNLLTDFSQSWATISPIYIQNCLDIFFYLYSEKKISLNHEIKTFSFTLRKEIPDEEIEEQEFDVNPIFVKFLVKDYGNDQLLKRNYPKLYFLSNISEYWEITGVQALAVIPDLGYVLLENKKLGENMFVSKKFFNNNQKFFENLGFAWTYEFSGEALFQIGIKFENPIFDSESLLPLVRKLAKKTNKIEIFTVIPAHNYEDYFIARENGFSRKGVIDMKGKFCDKIPNWMKNLTVFSIEGEAIIEKFLESKGGLLKLKRKLMIKQTRYFHKKNQERVLPISCQNFFIKKQSKSTSDIDKEMTISNKGIWGIPIPVFYKEENGEKNIFFDKKIEAFLKKLFHKHGIDIWYSWDVSDLLPEEYRVDAKNIIKGEEVFKSEWVDACFFFMDLKECSLKKIKKKEKKKDKNLFKQKPDLMIEGTEQIDDFMPYIYMVLNLKEGESLSKKFKNHNSLKDYDSIQNKLSKSSLLAKNQKIDEFIRVISVILNKNIENSDKLGLVLFKRENSISIENTQNIYYEITLDFLRFWSISQEDLKEMGDYNYNVLENLALSFKNILFAYYLMIEQIEKYQQYKELIIYFNIDELSFPSKLILHNLNLFCSEMEKSYTNLSFSSVYESINNFFGQILHDIYLKSIILPIEIEQYYVFTKICELSSRILAPIFPLLSQKIYSVIKGNDKNVFLSSFPKIPLLLQQKSKIFVIQSNFFVNFRLKVHFEIAKFKVKNKELALVPLEYVFYIEDPMGEEIEMLDIIKDDLEAFLGIGKVIIQYHKENISKPETFLGLIHIKLDSAEKILTFILKIYSSSLKIGSSESKKLIQN